MRLLQSVKLSVFAKPSEGENVAAITQALKELVPLDLVEEKIAVMDETAQGFHEQPIHIISITLTKQTHTTAFLKSLLANLTDAQKELLLQQKESRLDNELAFFIRLDKEQWLAHRQAVITDSGRCFHITLHLAAYPARRPDALELVEKIFKPN